MKSATRSMVIALAAAMAVGAIAPAMAQSAEPAKAEGYCDPEVARTLAERFKARQDDLDQSKDGLFKEIKKVQEQSIADLSSCVDLSWPTMSIQYPTMDQIIRGIAKEAVRKACGIARDKMSEVKSRFTQSYYLNTRIPGVPSYGISSSSYGSGGVQWGKSQATPSGAGNTGNSGNPTGGLYGGGGANPPPRP